MTKNPLMNSKSRRSLLKCSSLFLGAGLCLAHITSSAQDAPAETPKLDSSSAIQLPGVSIIGSEQANIALPASGTYLSGEDLTKYNISDVNRAVRQVPGVYVREEDGFGLFPNISLRGVSTERMNSITVMEDGILTAPAPYSAPDAYYSPNIGRMSGLEILKGSSQVRFGPQITGGALNYISTPIPTSETTSIRFSYGSYNDVIGHVWHGSVEDLGKMGSVGYLVEGYYQRNDGFKTIDTTPDFQNGDDTGFTRVEPMVKLFWELPTSKLNRLEFKYGYSDVDADETYTGLNENDFRADPFRRYSATRFDNIQATAQRASLRHEVELSPDLSLSTTAYYQYFKRNWEKLHDISTGLAPAVDVNISTALLDTAAGGGLAVLNGTAAGVLEVRNNSRDYELYGIQSVASAGFELGGMDHTAEIGIRYHFDEIDRFQWQNEYTQAAGGTIVAVTPGARGAAGDRVEQTHALAVHALDEIKWNKFTITPGLRVEYISQYYEQDLRRSGAGTPAFEEGGLTAVGGGLSVGYEIQQDWNAFAGIHRGFRIPGPRSTQRATPELTEETSLSYELGTRYHNHKKAYYAEAVGFLTQFDDLVVGQVGAGAGGPTENVGNINTLGLELAAGYDYGRANSWAVHTPFRLSVTLTDAYLDGNTTSTDTGSLFFGGTDGNKVPYIPEYQFNAEMGMEYGKVGSFLSATYVPSTFSTASNIRAQVNAGTGAPDARTGKTDAYLVLDWIVRYQLRENTTVFGGVKNLLDREYVASRHPHGPRPGLPRFFNVGLETQF